MQDIIGLSSQQKDIVDLPLVPFAVTACAGSGKTRTAVHRLARMRGQLNDRHGIIALLSFSNVAVDTFRRDYLTLMRTSTISRALSGVEIDTVDGFITTNVLRPHGRHAMKSKRTPFLVNGHEPFLKGFTIFDGTRPHPTTDIRFRIEAGKFAFDVGKNNVRAVLPTNAELALERLGKVGAYTHESGRYWVLKTLREFPYVLRALVRRYPHILVDEAQDIGPVHEAILELMVKGGSQLSLIGDVNQGIYEFSGANGDFLSGYGERPSVTAKSLEVNYRSVPDIVDIANRLSGRKDAGGRTAAVALNGAFFIPFEKNGRSTALSTFANMLQSANIAEEKGVVLCRSVDWAATWRGSEEGQGQGVVKAFADAAIYRDKFKRLEKAYEGVCAAVIGLLAKENYDLASRLVRPTDDLEARRMRQILWTFMRDPTTGLPSATLVADTEWHKLLLERAKALVEMLQSELGLSPGENFGHKLAKKKLENRPLIKPLDLAQPQLPKFRVSTVHRFKGDSSEGVMYVVNKEQAEKMLDGTNHEVGKIGYVAITRARNLFVLAVPEGSLKALEPRLIDMGFRKPGFQG